MATYSQCQPSVNDDCITPISVWKDIEQYIPNDKEIWCPFYCNGDHKLKELGYDIIHNEEDFFLHDRGEVIIDNPPFSIKRKILERMLILDKPFILIMPVSTLCYNYFKPFKDIQVIVPPKRINFAPHLKSNASFDCLYYCYKMNLYRDIIFL
tara:strand:- start:14056 stop:14514 length:459 start_codon:yes stop_codon:yes gene_type:complete